jgi:hypothetical protein
MLLLRHQALIYVFSETYSVITVYGGVVTPWLFLCLWPISQLPLPARTNIKMHGVSKSLDVMMPSSSYRVLSLEPVWKISASNTGCQHFVAIVIVVCDSEGDRGFVQWIHYFIHLYRIIFKSKRHAADQGRACYVYFAAGCMCSEVWRRAIWDIHRNIKDTFQNDRSSDGLAEGCTVKCIKLKQR